jgi:hypothetical protein
MRSGAGLLLALSVVAACLGAAGCGQGDAAAGQTVVAHPSLPSDLRLPTGDASRVTADPARPAPVDPSGAGRPMPAPAQSPSAVFSAADRASFAHLQATLPGPVGIAVSGVGLDQPVTALGSLHSGIAWSTSKVPVVMAALAAGTARAPDVDLALEASDNDAAMRIWQALGSPERAGTAATAELRAAGDRQTVIQSRVLAPGYTPFGQTEWSLTAQARFMAGMPCTREGLQTLATMRHVIPAQRWGLGTIDPQAAFKGGWGPGTLPGTQGPWLERQMGEGLIAGKPVAAVIAAQAPDANHAAAITALSQLAAWIAAHAHTAALPSNPAC